MTRDEVLDATSEAVRAATPLVDHLERLAARMAPDFPLGELTLAAWEDQPRESLHALLRMFEQLFDLVSRKLFRGLLTLSGETIATLSLQNQFRRVEALGAISSADRWIEIGATRNALVHDYPTNPKAQAARANRAWSDAADLIAFARSTVAWLEREGLVR